MAEYDINEPVRNDSVSVGTTAVLASQANVYRKVFVAKNTSTAGQVITMIGGSASATAGAGFVLNPSETLVDSDSEGYFAFRGNWRAISSAANGTIAIFER